VNIHQKIYVVLDTNVIVAGLLSSKKDSATVLVLEYLFEKKFTLLLTQDILLEYQKVLSRSKFSFSKELITGFLSVIDKLAEKVTPVSSEIKLTDMNDLPFYEAALSRGTESVYLVTGNNKHFPPESFIVTPRRFLEIIEEENI